MTVTTPSPSSSEPTVPGPQHQRPAADVVESAPSRSESAPPGQKAEAMPALTAGWMIPMVIGFSLGPVLLAAGLARGRVLSWWTIVLPVAGAVLITAGHDLAEVGFLVTLAVWAVFGLVAGRALWTARAVDAQD